MQLLIAVDGFGFGRRRRACAVLDKGCLIDINRAVLFLRCFVRTALLLFLSSRRFGKQVIDERSSRHGGQSAERQLRRLGFAGGGHEDETEGEGGSQATERLSKATQPTQLSMVW